MPPSPTPARTEPPRILVVPDGLWEDFAEKFTEAAYEKWDNALDRAGLDRIVDVVAGAFYHHGTHAVYCSMRVWRGHNQGTAWCIDLMVHEYGHAMDWPLEDHPTGLRQGFRHAREVGFDSRAYTRWLRWRHGDQARRSQAEKWLDTTKPTFITAVPSHLA